MISFRDIFRNSKSAIEPTTRLDMHSHPLCSVMPRAFSAASSFGLLSDTLWQAPSTFCKAAARSTSCAIALDAYPLHATAKIAILLIDVPIRMHPPTSIIVGKAGKKLPMCELSRTGQFQAG